MQCPIKGFVFSAWHVALTPQGARRAGSGQPLGCMLFGCPKRFTMFPAGARSERQAMVCRKQGLFVTRQRVARLCWLDVCATKLSQFQRWHLAPKGPIGMSLLLARDSSQQIAHSQNLAPAGPRKQKQKKEKG